MEQAIKLKKGQYLKQLATPKVKAKATTTVIMTILCIVAMLLGLYLACTTPVDELPLISLALDITGMRSQFNEVKTELAAVAGGIDTILSTADDTVPQIVITYMGELSDLAKELAQNISLWNLQKLVTLYADFPAELGTALDAETMATVSMVVMVVKAVIAAFAVCILFPMLLTTLGGFCRVTALVVLGMIFSLPITGALYMGPLFLLCLLTHILLIVFLVQVNKAYKIYKRAPVAPATPVAAAPAEITAEAPAEVTAEAPAAEAPAEEPDSVTE